MWGSLAFGYMLVSRMAYVLGVGLALSQQERHEYFTRRYGAAGGYKRFRSWSSLLMVNDTVAFIAACVLTANTMFLTVHHGVQVAAGVVIAAVGIATKAWATARLGANSYYWHNFFVPSDPVFPDPPGPYRFLKNPMYGVGYLQTYGFALMTASWPGLIASVYMQATILVFNQLVEKPHLESLIRKASDRRNGMPAPELGGGTSPRVG